MKRFLSLSLLLTLLLGLVSTTAGAHCARRTACGRAAAPHAACVWTDADGDGYCDNCARQHAPKVAAPCASWCDADNDGWCDTCHFQHAPKAAPAAPAAPSAPANAGHHGNAHHGGHHGW